MKKLMLLGMVFCSTAAFSAEIQSYEARLVNEKCVEESIKAGCEKSKVGTGLIKCLKIASEENSQFLISEDCNNAVNSFVSDRNIKASRNARFEADDKY
jgi:hypothetical protein